jgi:hypothetical protein
MRVMLCGEVPAGSYTWQYGTATLHSDLVDVVIYLNDGYRATWRASAREEILSDGSTLYPARSQILLSEVLD